MFCLASKGSLATEKTWRNLSLKIERSSNMRVFLLSLSLPIYLIRCGLTYLAACPLMYEAIKEALSLSSISLSVNLKNRSN